VVRSGTRCRLGWATCQYVASNNIPIGNNENSWAIDIDGKKYYNGMGTFFYGDNTKVNDVYGCFVDFQLRKIWYTKNEKYLGFAFSNLRVDGLYPIISIGHNTKVSVNFGPNFKYPFIATHSLNPTLSNKEKRLVEKLWKKYQSLSVLEDNPSEAILNQGILALGSDLGSTDPLDPELPIFAWKLSSRTQWNFHKDEFMTAMALERIFTPDDLIKSSKKWLIETSENTDVFRSWYMFMFDYLKPGSQATVIAVDEAILAWKILGIHKIWSVFDKWEDYLKTAKVKTINNDTWSMLLTLIEKVGNDPKKFDESDCWASLIEDFVLDHWKK